jgi:hypothetical protein
MDVKISITKIKVIQLRNMESQTFALTIYI